MTPLLTQIGKFGDCINILPFAYMMSQKIGKVDWLVGEKWASLLEGCSYVNPVIWYGTDDDLPKAVEHFRSKRPLWVTQAWKNPDRTIATNSFSKEQWRYVGMLSERGKWPLIFDRRNFDRESELAERHIPKGNKKKVVLCATTSISTPYRYATQLLEKVKTLDAHVIDMNDVVAERVYDMLGLLDRADLLITVDTLIQHLARASHCPVIALINDGWHGAIPVPQTIWAARYAEIERP